MPLLLPCQHFAQAFQNRHEKLPPAKPSNTQSPALNGSPRSSPGPLETPSSRSLHRPTSTPLPLPSKATRSRGSNVHAWYKAFAPTLFQHAYLMASRPPPPSLLSLQTSTGSLRPWNWKDVSKRSTLGSEAIFSARFLISYHQHHQ